MIVHDVRGGGTDGLVGGVGDKGSVGGVECVDKAGYVGGDGGGCGSNVSIVINGRASSHETTGGAGGCGESSAEATKTRASI